MYAEEKRSTLLSYLSTGQVVSVWLTPGWPGVTLPVGLLDAEVVRLDIGHNMPTPIPDLNLSGWGLRATLSFGGQGFFCAIPWGAIQRFDATDGRITYWPELEPPAEKSGEHKILHLVH